jgi:ABC-type antimicrobial peptide transport system permease subunit
MNHFISAKIAVQHMAHKPLRTLLILQGIIWATAVVVFPPAIREGSRRNAINYAREFATDTISVRIENKLGSLPLTLKDIDTIKSNFSERDVSSISPFIIRDSTIKLDDRRVSTTIIATDHTSGQTRSFDTVSGRYLERKDIQKARAVCVVEQRLSRKLFGTQDPVGEMIEVRIAGEYKKLKIVGLMEELPEERVGSDDFGLRSNRRKVLVHKIKFMAGLEDEPTDWKRNQLSVHLPLGLFPDVNELDWIILKTEPYRLEETAAKIQNHFMGLNKKPVIIHNLILPLLMGNKLKVSNELSFALFLICLSMGGIMIMNIMLVSVTERTREIGIRRAEGATRGNILSLFMVEGICLCAIGALIGIPLGVLLARIAAHFEPYSISTAVIPVQKSIFALGWSIFIGLLSSILPALRAANLPPAIALKHE